MHKYKAEISGISMCYFLCCCKGDDDEDKDNEINLFKLDEKSLEQLEKTEIEHTGRVQNNFISSSHNFRPFWNGLDGPAWTSSQVRLL